MSPTPPGAASATGSTDSESGPAPETEPDRSEDRTDAVPVLGESPDQEEPPVEDEAVAPPHAPPYDQWAAPYDQRATEDALPTLAGPAPGDVTDVSSDEPEAPAHRTESSTESVPSANGEAHSVGNAPTSPATVSDDTAPFAAPVGPVGSNGYDYGDQPIYAEAPTYGDPSGYSDQPVYDGPPVPAGQLTYGDELAYGAAPLNGDAPPPGDPAGYGDQLAYGGAPLPTDQLTYGEPYPFGVAPFEEAPFGAVPVVAPPFVAPPWPQPEVPAGPVLLPPPTGTPRRGVRSLPRPKKRPQTRKGRRVKRVVRRIELWSVLKVSLLFYSCMYVVALAAVVLLWGFAYSTKLIDNFESFMEDIGFVDFQFFGDQLFKEVAIVGAVLVVAGALLTVLAVALVNVISEVTGGVRFVVIEIDADERPSARQP